ncbi:2-hydroxy-3-oxopropionate reductase [soil metagenome]
MNEPSTAGAVGFVGLGAMGSRMVRCLLERGRTVVAWNRTPSTMPAQEGLEFAASPREVAEQTDVVLGCLRDDRAIDSVYRGPDGLLAGVHPRQLFMEHGTFSPSLAVALHVEAAALGAVFIDAPVTGGPEGAAAGTLAAMAGGGREEIAARADLFSAYLASISVVGPVGSGLRLKLVNQLLVSIHMAAAAEAAALLGSSGIDLADALPVLSAGWAASAMLDRELPRSMRRDFQAAGATIDGMVAVQHLVAGALREAGIESTVFADVRRLFQGAVAAGHADDDPAALVAMYDRQQR